MQPAHTQLAYDVAYFCQIYSGINLNRNLNVNKASNLNGRNCYNTVEIA